MDRMSTKKLASFSSNTSSQATPSTDIIEGTSLAKWFACAAICACLMMGLSLLMYLHPAGYFYLGKALVSAVTGSSAAWMIFVWSPLIVGGGLLILSLLMILIALLTGKRAKQLDALSKLLCWLGYNSATQNFGSCNRFFVFLIKIGAFFWSLILLLGSIGALSLLMNVQVSVENGALSTANRGSVQANILDFSVAVFNECCAATGNSDQGFIPQCEANATENIANGGCNLPNQYEFFSDELCRCYFATDDEYAKMRAEIRKNDVCGILQDAKVEINDVQRVPGTSIRVSSLIESSFVYVVGPIAEEGCGKGLGAGLQYMLYRWTFSMLQPVVYGMLGASGLLFLSILSGVYNHYWQKTMYQMRFESDDPMWKGSRISHSLSAHSSSNSVMPPPADSKGRPINKVETVGPFRAAPQQDSDSLEKIDF